MWFTDPQTFVKSFWKNEIYLLLDYASSSCDDLLVLGDLKCNLLQPVENGIEGKDLIVGSA